MATDRSKEFWDIFDSILGELKAPETTVGLGTLLFLRWSDFQEAESEAIAAFEGSDYEPALPSPLHWRSWYALPGDDLEHVLTVALPDTLRKLNNVRHNRLATYLHHLLPGLDILSKLPIEPLSRLVAWLAAQPFETPQDRLRLLHVLDQLSGEDLGRYSGYYQTPDSVSRLLAALADPQPGQRVYDPCFGQGRLLISAYEHVTGQQVRRPVAAGETMEVTGGEINPLTYIVGMTRMVLSGIQDPLLELGNSLERGAREGAERDGYDVALSDPPFAERIDTKALGRNRFPISTRDSSALFIQHALEQLRPGGRAVLTVPQGLLFRGAALARLREHLLRNHTVEAVVGLPETVLMPFTAVRVSILVVRRGGSTKRIRMVDGGPYFERGRSRSPATISHEGITELLKGVRAEGPSEHCWDVNVPDLGFVNWDLTARRRDESGLEGQLLELSDEVRVTLIRDCCEVGSGYRISAKHLRSQPETDSPVAYVRIGDIQRGIASGASSWVDASCLRKKMNRLRGGDVLLSKSGTIGKAGIVRNGAIGGVASSGLAVLRCDPNEVLPSYLVAYLTSDACQLHLDSWASGATIRHLRRDSIEALPIAIPAIQIQERVASEFRESGADAFIGIRAAVSAAGANPAREWLQETLARMASGGPSRSAGAYSALDWLAGRAREARKECDRWSWRPEAGQLVRWFSRYAEAISRLQGIGDVPDGPSQYGLLVDCQRWLEEAGRSDPGDLQTGDAARELASLVLSIVRERSEELLRDVTLDVYPSSDFVVRGVSSELALEFHNLGSLPLRNIAIATTPDWGRAQLAFLPDQGVGQATLEGFVPSTAGAQSLGISWKAETLDGTEVGGEESISVAVRESAGGVGEDTADGLTGGSPYVCGDPLRPGNQAIFFGRDETLAQIKRQIARTGNVVLLEGNRRSGKSSVLHHLEGLNTIPGWLSVYCSLQGAEGSRERVGIPTEGVFRELAKSIAGGLTQLDVQVALPDGSILQSGKRLGIAKACRQGIGTEAPFDDLRDYVEMALGVLESRGLGLVILLDEFDKLQEGIDNGVTSPQVPENIRFLVQNYPRVSAVLTGSRRLKRLREEYWSALFGLGTRIPLTSLDAEAARDLVIRPVRSLLTYSDEAVERVIHLTARQPFLVQCLCSKVYDSAAQLGRRSVTREFVDEASRGLVEDNEHFAFLWDFLARESRRLLLALCHREAEGPDPLTIGLMEELLSGFGLEIEEKTLIDDLEFLIELELLERAERAGGKSYLPALPLMGYWIRRHQDFTVLVKRAAMGLGG